MTDTIDGDLLADPTSDPTATVLRENATVGENVFYAGTRLPIREGDASLRPKDRAQYPVPPNSLLWKYMGDPFVLLVSGQRTAIIENMWPQLGQGVSDHSMVVKSKDPAVQAQRAKSSQKTINGVLYAAPEDAQKYGIQVRNFHKSIKGDMPDGHRYHALNAETFYWAHVTFFEAIYRASDLGVLERPLTRDEKEQIFEESKEWFSLFGVDDSAQPQTYDEFEQYLRNVFDHELVNSKLAQYTVGLARQTLRVEKFVPKKYHWFAKPLAPRLRWFTKMITIAGLEPEIKRTLEVDEIWSTWDERRYRMFVAFLRATRIALRRMHTPLKYRYSPAAAAAFAREGIDPDDITLESARQALAQARANRARADHDTTLATVLEATVDATEADTCAKCKRNLEPCEECSGTGTVDGEHCDVCHGARFGCRVHHADWRVAA
jgi:uncharacterized protein (DUF2236 family)